MDDNVDAAQSLAVLLEMTGHEVRLAYDGPSALEAAIEYRPDVVLVALTGYGQDTDRQRSQEAGFDHHLVKPATFDEIEKILRSVAEKTT